MDTKPKLNISDRGSVFVSPFRLRLPLRSASGACHREAVSEIRLPNDQQPFVVSVGIEDDTFNASHRAEAPKSHNFTIGVVSIHFSAFAPIAVSVMDPATDPANPYCADSELVFVEPESLPCVRLCVWPCVCRWLLWGNTSTFAGCIAPWTKAGL